MWYYENVKRINELKEMEQKVLVKSEQLEIEKKNFKRYKESVVSLAENARKTLEGYAILERTSEVISKMRDEFDRDYNFYQSCTVLLERLNELCADKRYETKCLVDEITGAAKDKRLQLLNAGMDRVKLAEMTFSDVIAAENRRDNSSDEGNHPSRRYPSM